ncbi:MAG: hypothetical protein IJD56_01780 [Peptococcaceae bacterium]|nr:hypothetical protein [Peptococcaceae bacterium]
MLDYIILAFFAAYLGLKFAQTRATGYLWFLLPLLLIVGLNQGWASHFGPAFFVVYRIATILSCVLAAYMYYRDYHKRKADAIAENTKKRKVQEEKYRAQQAAEKAKKTENKNSKQKQKKK